MLRTLRWTQLPLHIGQLQTLQINKLGTKTGLFGKEGLDKPRDFLRLAAEAHVKCTALADEAASAHGIGSIRKTDELSDAICSVYDAAELCRSVHIDPDWRHSAEQACISIGGLLSRLNMHQGLYSSVVAAIGGDGVSNCDRIRDTATTAGSHQAATRGSKASAWRPAHAGATGGRVADGTVGSRTLPAAALRTGQLLCQDFELQGVHLRGSDKQAFVEATAREHQLCMQFGENMGDAQKYPVLHLDATEAAALGPLPLAMRRTFARSKGALHVPTHDAILVELLTKVENSSLRRKAFSIAASGPSDNLAVIDGVVGTRNLMAQLLGAPSYAHYQARRGTVAETPEAIALFLRHLADSVRDKAQSELASLNHHSDRSTVGIQPWDEMRLRHLALGGHPTLPLCTVSEATAALTEVCSRLFQVDLVPVPLCPGEAWAPGIVKLAVIDQAHVPEGALGHLYLDLYSRPGKVVGPGMQYTIVSGRLLPDGSYQKPLAALICNFPRNQSALLSVSAVTTLFHEFGHVLNVLLNTTEFQHVAGTRGTSDTVEVASQLMEYLVEPRLFRSKAAASALQQHTRSEQAFAALDIQKQIFFARLDLELHGSDAPTGTAILDLVHSIATETLSIPPLQGAAPHARFGHLAASGSGGKYHSYLLSKCFAAAAWQQQLSADPYNAAAGKHIRESLLSVGMSLAPRRMIDGLLGPGAVRAAADGFVPCIEPLLKEIGA